MFILIKSLPTPGEEIEEIILPVIKVAFFDMDHTVIDTDCDVSWKYFLVDEGLAPVSDRAEADRFFILYHQGQTNVEEFIRFQLREFRHRTPGEMQALARRHFDSRVRQYIYPRAGHEIENYRTAGIPVFLLTGTNRIIAEPIANELGVDQLFATEPAIHNGYFTGTIQGPFLMRDEKLNSALIYCRSKGIDLEHVTYYADSITDLKLLEQVGAPVVVNPGAELLRIARARGWSTHDWSLAHNSPFSKKMYPVRLR